MASETVQINWMDCVAIIISLLAFIVSVIAIAQARRINNTNLEAIYYEQIFKKYLTRKIPRALNKLKFEDGYLNVSYRVLNDTLTDMLEAAKYFEFVKADFYEKLKRITVDIDDLLVSSSAKQFKNRHEEELFKNNIKESVAEMFVLIDKYYHS